jgi:hypothetical protein
VLDLPVFLVVRLPRPVLVGQHALDLRVPSKLAGGVVEVVLPSDQDDDPVLDMDDLTALQNRDDTSADERLAAMWQRASAATSERLTTTPMTAYGPARDTPAAPVRRLLVRIDEINAGATRRFGLPDNDVVTTVASARSDVEHWWSFFAAWVEVYTDQDLDHLHPRLDGWVEGGGVGTFEPSGRRRPVGSRVRVMQRDEIPVSAALLAHACRRAGENERPPLHHDLLRTARGQAERELLREAVLSAATATELVLVAAADERGVSLNLMSDTLGTIVRKLHDADVLSNAERDTLRELNKARNDAAHRGTATPESTRRAVTIATACAHQFSPLTHL